MSPNPLLGRSRSGLSALVVLAAVVAALWRTSVGPPVVDAGDVAADPGARRGSEVIVTGNWVMTVPSDSGHMVVILRGRDGGRVVCHFEDVPVADRARLELPLNRSAEAAVRGRCDGVENGRAVLRGCRLLD
jgi:hypothetical protein